jgi:phosphatidylserine/phosphatidylglycerophosphate/cardiolipin synthase-like enzyme
MGAPTDINQIVASFFVAAADVTGAGSVPGEMVPDTTGTNQVTHLIDGDNYFGALRTEVDALKAAGVAADSFFYFANWWLEFGFAPGGSVESGPNDSTAWRGKIDPSTAFILDDEKGGAYPKFLDELEAMAANGVDVRALPWVNPFIPNYGEVGGRVPGLFVVNVSSLTSASMMRAKPHLKTSVVLNTVGHPIAAMHLKCVICGNPTSARAYVSGLDLVSNRVDSQKHLHGATYGWHDVGAKIEGPATYAVFKYFKALWDEVISRPVDKFRLDGTEIDSYVTGTAACPDPFTAASPGPGTMRVQVLRTAPQFNFAFGSTSAVPISWYERLGSGFKRPVLSFAPNGIFEFRAALRKAIANANDFIYVEDQGFQSQEIMDWINARLKAKPELKAIFVHGADPADPPSNLTDAAVNDHLAPGIAAPAAQVAFYERTDQTVIHAKTWIIDDVFAIIGSANFFRRSLYSDGEMSVGVADETAGPGGFVPKYRADLWGEHCGVVGAGAAAFLDLAQAITIWDPGWKVYGAAAAGVPPGALSAVFQRKDLPFTAGPAPTQFIAVDTTVSTSDLDLMDPDSTQEL